MAACRQRSAGRGGEAFEGGADGADGDVLEVAEAEQVGIAGDDELGAGGAGTGEHLVVVGITAHARHGGGLHLESDPIGLEGGLNTYGYVRQNPMSAIDPLGLEEINLGRGYTGRVDSFNLGGQGSFELHVMNPQGREVGIYGPNGWIGKHGFTGKPPNLPIEVENQCKGVAVDQMRRAGLLPPKGRANIKGSLWMKALRGWPLIGPLIEATQPSVDRACSIDDSFEAC
jgi:hypothetical protein